MSDLDEIRSLVIDDLIVGAVGGKLEMSPADIETMISDKVHDLFDSQGELGISYTMDELNAGQSWWLIEALGMDHYDAEGNVLPPVTFQTPSESVPAEGQPSEGDGTTTMSSPIEQSAVDMVASQAIAPDATNVQINEVRGGIGAVGYFAILILVSIIFYIFRKSRQMSRLPRKNISPFDNMT